MKAKEIRIGQVYMAKISGRLSPVKLLSLSRYNDRHWIAQNLRTKRRIVIRSAAKLRGRLEPVYHNNVRQWRLASKTA